jgi:ATP-dependent RNA helicase DeaD
MPDENRRGGYVNGNVNGNVKGGFNRSRRNYRKKREG